MVRETSLKRTLQAVGVGAPPSGGAPDALASNGSEGLQRASARLVRNFVEQSSERRRLGPFILVEQLGKGGFAPVWLAKEVYGQTELRSVAIKLFALHGEADGVANAPEISVQILQEAQALCRIEHPNVVRFYALPVDQQQGVLGLAMEYVAGVSLAQRLTQAGRLDVLQTVELGISLASALAAVHRVGLVHRDVKPANIVESRGVYKLIDFGIAAADVLAADEARPMEVPSDVTERWASRCGTLGYMDPVCYSTGASATPASDLYALGATLFQCLLAKVPAEFGANYTPLCHEVLDGRKAPPAVAELSQEVPKSLALLIDALLHPERERRPQSAEWVSIHLQQIRGDLLGRRRRLPDESLGPFRGLGPFEPEDRDIYFGRSAEVAAALEMLRCNGLVALIGASGSGKSSLARAGVLPALVQNGLGGWPTRWDAVVTTPGARPRVSLAKALAGWVQVDQDTSADALVTRLGDAVQARECGLVLLIDQLEELATVSEEPERSWLATVLKRLGEHVVPGVRVVVAARRDLVDSLLTFADLNRALVRGAVFIEPLTALMWNDVVEQALSAYGYAFEDEALRREIVAQIEDTHAAMPLVQFTLKALWDARDAKRKQVTWKALSVVGGLHGALGRHADNVLEQLILRDPAVEPVARGLLLALTTAEGTRSRRSLTELEALFGPSVRSVARAFEKARLIVRDGDDFTLAHEALLTAWDTLRGWVSAVREDRLLAEEIEHDARLWQAPEKGAPLWRGRRLAFALDLKRAGSVELSGGAERFLEEGRRAERRGRWLFGGATAAALLVLLGVGFAYVQAVRGQETLAREALLQEQANREMAERTTLEVQAKQQQIDRLLRELADSPKKQEVVTLQKQIRAATAKRRKDARPPRRISVRASQPAKPSASAGLTGSIKVQREW